MNKSIKILLLICIALSINFCASMKTQQKQHEGVDNYINNGKIDSALVKIEKSKNIYYKKKDRVLYYLDVGMLNHFAGNYQNSNTYLARAEREIENLYTKSVSKGAFSLLLNDNALDYFGEDYEDIYINVFMALNYLHRNKLEDGEVEIRKINNKLKKLESKYSQVTNRLNQSSKENYFKIKYGKNNFYNSALGNYLSFLMYRKKEKYGDAKIDLNRIDEVFSCNKNIYNFAKPRIDKNLKDNRGKTKLNIICSTGKSPLKKENKLVIETGDGYLSISGKGDYDFSDIISMDVKKGFHIKFSFPEIYQRNSEIDFIKVMVDSKPYKMMKIEDIGNVAENTFEIKKPIIYGKSLTRALVKGLGSNLFKKWMRNKAENEAKEQKKKTDDDDMVTFLLEAGTDLANWAVDSAVDATENADLRTSRYFPDAIYIAEAEIPPGAHSVKIQFFNEYGRLLKEDNQNVITKPGSLNIVESFCLN